MASIDRYRPPREGYQPPTLPLSTGRQEHRPSRSPSRKRDVPPPAPSPPTHTSRTSPPRAQSSRLDVQSSPAASSPRSPRPTSTNQWLFTADEVRSTPSILDGLEPAVERVRRAKGINFIYQAGVLLDLPQITLWVAGVFFHRFYMRYSMVEEKNGIHHYNIAATALFLANKTEENCRKTKDIIVAVARVAQKNSKLIIDEQSKEYWRWRDSILMYEELMLELLTFDLMIDNPYQRLFELLSQLEMVHNRPLRHAAWGFCNDACLTNLPLLMEARGIAIAAIFFASIHTKQTIEDVNGDPWYRFLNCDEDKCCTAINIIYEFYTENPLQKPNPSMPSPPFSLDSTRRRGEPLVGSQTPSAVTPLDLDRSTQSPRSRANGGADASSSQATTRPESMSKEKAHEVPGSPSSSKRKGADSDLDSDAARRQKRSRVSGEDEGQEIQS